MLDNYLDPIKQLQPLGTSMAACQPHCVTQLSCASTQGRRWAFTRLSKVSPAIQKQSPTVAAPPTLQQQRSQQAAVAALPPAADGQQQHQPQEQRRTVQLKAIDISEENFKPFGQLIGATDDGKEFDSEDAQLELDQGQPRFYIMRLPHRGRRFERITYHAKVTQCLGGLQPSSPWFLVLARPTLSVQQYPRQEDLTAFRIPHGVFVKLHKGTWHAGPLFDADSADFYNLELSDTNVVDHNTHDYSRDEGLVFEVVD